MTGGYFGIGVWHPKFETNVGTLWRSAHCFGASFLFTVGPRYRRQATDVTHAPAHVPLLEFRDLDALVAGLPQGCPLVTIETDTPGSIALPSFCHPRRACYLLGAEDHGLPPKVLDRAHIKLTIPGADHCLNVASAGSIVIYDRFATGAKAGFWEWAA